MLDYGELGKGLSVFLKWLVMLEGKVSVHNAYGRVKRESEESKGKKEGGDSSSLRVR